jgi:hypothetical protein
MSPCPLLTTKPLDATARNKHAFVGWLFDISMCCFTIDHCECCGRTAPVQGDMSMKALLKESFQREHLAMKFHPVDQCNCWGVCLAGQFYHFGGFKHRQWYELHHDSISHLWPSDDNAQICKS